MHIMYIVYGISFLCSSLSYTMEHAIPMNEHRTNRDVIALMQGKNPTPVFDEKIESTLR